MILLQISSAQGPDECALAVALALKQLQKEAAAEGVEVTIAEQGNIRKLMQWLWGCSRLMEMQQSKFPIPGAARCNGRVKAHGAAEMAEKTGLSASPAILLRTW